jgi:hypothetical protein
MGTNYYLFTKNKKIAQKYAPYSYSLVDTPKLGYKIHIGKCSMGWLPLFEAHQGGICSIKEYKAAYDTGKFKIYDEYNREYDWFEFEINVLQYNGGIAGIMHRKHFEKNPSKPFYDPDIPQWVPISHFDTKYAHMYFKDDAGFEFTEGAFS